jgi:uncharacterized RDD family membrane protein YckC
MPCLLCGEICRCSSAPESFALPRWLPESEAPAEAVPPAEESKEISDREQPPDGMPASPVTNEGAADEAAWRQEVAARLNRYQSRRKPRPPRYPSLRLHFEQEADKVVGATEFSYSTQVSNQAVAFHEVAASHSIVRPDAASSRVSNVDPNGAFAEGAQWRDEASHSNAVAVPVSAPTSAPTSAKIIEFPRSWALPVAPLDELAEPVMTSPRILEAPEMVPPPPALGGITIERIEPPALEKRPGIDIPLQTAPRGRRLLAALVDFIFIAAACTVFSLIFWKLTAIRPPKTQILGVLTGMAAVFCSAYQYLLIIYAATTPGLRLARLELSRFDGSPANRRLRRWRVLASFLSAAALGMGYGWVFLDEDSLCWHDRITHTYLARRSQPKAGSSVTTDPAS